MVFYSIYPSDIKEFLKNDGDISLFCSSLTFIKMVKKVNLIVNIKYKTQTSKQRDDLYPKY